MIPILYESIEGKSTSPFVTNGLGGLSDAATCIVTEERNGMFELEMTYPTDGIHFSEIKVDRLILSDASENSKNQIFRIYEVEKPLNELVTIRAEHISYLLTKVVVLPFTAGTAADAFNGIRNNVQWNSAARYFKTFPFTFWTDNTTAGSVNIEAPTSVRGALYGTEGSILDACHGEYEFDNFTVKLHAKRGTDTDVVLRYGKNITDLTNTDDISNSFMGILPYWKGTLEQTSSSLDSDNNVVTENVEVTIFVTAASQSNYNNGSPNTRTNYLNGKTLWIKNDNNNYGYPLSIPVDLSSMELNDYEAPELEQGSSEADVTYANRLKNAKRTAEANYKEYVLNELTKKANEYLNNNAGINPTNTIKVSFVQLWNTEEYKDVAVLEHVNLCDTVQIYYPEFDIAARSKVIKTEYNVLLDRYESIELGDGVTNAADSIVSGISDIEEEFNKQLAEGKRDIISTYKQAIIHATDLINGGLGGYLVTNTNAAGQPNELLIMDSPSKNTAKNVWRFNLNGLGHSHSGYAGPFNDVALTMDGKINATMISTGILDAAIIRAGILQDVKGWNKWDLESGEFRMAATSTVGGKQIASTDYIDDAVERLEITVDVRNLMINTLYPDVSQAKNFPRIYGQPNATVISGTATAATHGIRVTNTAQTRTSLRFGETSNGSMCGLVPGVSYTLSFDYTFKQLSGTISGSDSYYFTALVGTSSGTISSARIREITSANRGKTLSGSGTFTFTLPENVTMIYFFIACSYTTASGYGTTDFIELRNIMLESGKAAHKWTAANEDYYDNGLGQEKVFNKLTNNGTIQGLYMKSGQLYINAEYISAGTFKTDVDGNRVLMEGSTAAIKGYYNNTLITVFDTVNGTNASTAKTVLDSKNGLALISPNMYVYPGTYGTGHGTVYKAKTNAIARFIFWHGSYWSDGKLTELVSLNAGIDFKNGLYTGLHPDMWGGKNNPYTEGNSGIIEWECNGVRKYTSIDATQVAETVNI